MNTIFVKPFITHKCRWVSEKNEYILSAKIPKASGILLQMWLAKVLMIALKLLQSTFIRHSRIIIATKSVIYGTIESI